MGKNKPPKIPAKVAAEVKKASALPTVNPKIIKAFGLASGNLPNQSQTDSLSPYIVLKYFDDNWECFSAWQKEDLKHFSAFIKKLHQNTWKTVYSSEGMNYTSYKLETVKSGAKAKLESVAKKISEDINFFELRVNQKLRVHGFRVDSAFFLVLLDREHRVFPE